MSGIAQELDDTLQRIDPLAAEQVTRLVREILLLAQARGQREDSSNLKSDCDAPLLDLAAHAEPMGTLTNAEIDRAVYGR